MTRERSSNVVNVESLTPTFSCIIDGSLTLYLLLSVNVAIFCLKMHQNQVLCLVFWATVCKTVCLILSDRCLSCLSVCDVGVSWPNGLTDQDETWHAGRPRPWPHCVRWGPSSPLPKGAQPPNFRPISVSTKWLHRSRCHLVWT